MLRHGHEAIRHGVVEATWTIHRDDGDDAGLCRHLFERVATGNGHHADAVQSAARADGSAVVGTVRIHEIREVSIEMTRPGRQLYWRADLIANDVDGIEVLSQLDEIAVVLMVTRAATAQAVMHIRWPGYETKDEMAAAQSHAMRWVSWCQREC